MFFVLKYSLISDLRNNPSLSCSFDLENVCKCDNFKDSPLETGTASSPSHVDTTHVIIPIIFGLFLVIVMLAAVIFYLKCHKEVSDDDFLLRYSVQQYGTIQTQRGTRN